MAKEIKLNKKDVKSPDQIQVKLQKGFTFTTEHSKLLGGALVLFILVGVGFSAKTYFDTKAETKAQAKYFAVEKQLLEIKNNFEAANEPAKPKDPKDKTPAPVLAKASGDFDKDYGTVVPGLTSVIQDSPKSTAAKMAALSLSEIQMQYQKYTEAQATLNMVKADSHDLLSAMVQSQLGSLQADQKDCNSAVGTWQKVLGNSAAKALHGSVKLKQGLCYEAMNDIPKARATYTALRDEDKESQSAKTAEKYLRLLPGQSN